MCVLKLSVLQGQFVCTNIKCTAGPVCLLTNLKCIAGPVCVY